MSSTIADLPDGVTAQAGDRFPIARSPYGPGDNYRLTPTQISQFIGARERLVADRDYYVRTDGSDSNDGLSNTSGGAFLTIGHAILVVVNLDLANQYRVRVNVAAGTYDLGDGIIMPGDPVGAPLTSEGEGGSVTILGDPTTPSNVVIFCSSYNTAILMDHNTAWLWNGFTIEQSYYGSCVNTGPGRMVLRNMRYIGDMSGNYIVKVDQGRLILQGTQVLDGGFHWSFITANRSAAFTNASGGVTFLNTPQMFAATAEATLLGLIQDIVAYTGAATGKRYSADLNAVIATGGGGANKFPGDVAGTTATGGQYV